MKPYIRTGLIWSALLLAIMVATVLATTNALPDSHSIPLHWGVDGTPDRIGSRAQAAATLWILPGVSLFVAAVLAAAPLIDPRRGNIEKGRKAYLVTWISVMVLMAFVTAGVCLGTVKGAHGGFDSRGLVRWIIANCALLFIVIGNYLPKTRPSYMFGVRTPWTLSSDMAWEKTHRVAGRLFIIAGVLGFIGAFVWSGIWLALQLSALVFAAAIISVVYSYFAWRAADDHDEGTSLTV
jgi:uncharacterized membrane protein